MARDSQSAETRRVIAAVDQACSSDGMSQGLEFYSDKTLFNIQKEAYRARLLSRKIGAWVNTKRTTLVPICAVGRRNAYHLPFVSELWMPATTNAAYQLSEAVQQAGKELGMPALARWQPTRIGVNYMHGTELEPAIIPPHTDPVDESGLVAVMQVSSEGSARENGRLQFIIGADVCHQLGIIRPVHEVCSTEERTSLTIANLR